MKRSMGILLALYLLSAAYMPVMGQSLSQKKFQPQPLAILSSTRTQQLKKKFVRAVWAGDLKTVQNLVEHNSWIIFLREKINSPQPVYPICVAASNGHNALVKYMIAKDPSLLKVQCENSGGNLFDVAIENKKADTAALLLSFKKMRPGADPQMPPFVKVATYIRDRAALQKVIPALLQTKADPNQLYRDKKQPIVGDAFYEAAGHKNIHFITVLRDEMKKHGQPIAQVVEYLCPNYTPEQKTGAVDLVRHSPRVELLEQNGVIVYITTKDHKDTYQDCI